MGLSYLQFAESYCGDHHGCCPLTREILKLSVTNGSIAMNKKARNMMFDVGCAFASLRSYSSFSQFPQKWQILTFSASVVHNGLDASILSYVKMLSYAKDLIPDICGIHINNSELHKFLCNFCRNCEKITLTCPSTGSRQNNALKTNQEPR